MIDQGPVERAARPRRRRGLIGLAVVVAVLVAGNFVPGGPLPLIIALAFGAAAVALWRSRLNPVARAAGVATTACVAVGGVLLFFRDVRLAGVILLCLAAVAALPFFTEVIVGARGRRRGSPRPSNPRAATPAERVVALVAGVCAGLFALGVAANVARDDDGYYRRYGTSVTVNPGAGCQDLVSGRSSRTDPTRILSCQHASWQVSGVTVNGLLTSRDLSAFDFGDTQVPAYAVDGVARAATGMRDLGPVVVFGKLPTVWLWSPFAVALPVWIILLLLGRRRSG